MGIAPSELEQIIPPHFEVPHRLKRRSIKETQLENGGEFLHDLWNERGDIIEIRTQKIIASLTSMVASVTLKEKFAEGSDLIVKFVPGFPLKEADIEVEVEVKSSSLALRQGKQKIRRRMLDEEARKETDGQINNPLIRNIIFESWKKLSTRDKELKLSSYLTKINRMLVNGGEQDLKEKPSDEILRDSIFPQLERLVWKSEGMTPEETVIRQREGQAQIWPWIGPSNFTQLTVEKEPSHSNPVLDKLKKYLASSFWSRIKYPSSFPIQLFR